MLPVTGSQSTLYKKVDVPPEGATSKTPSGPVGDCDGAHEGYDLILALGCTGVGCVTSTEYVGLSPMLEQPGTPGIQTL